MSGVVLPRAGFAGCDLAFGLAADHAGGSVQDPVAQGFGLGFRNGPSRQSRRSQKRYAIEASGLYIKLRRRSDNMPYNEAPVIVGDEANRARVELLREWPTSYRPAADIDDDDDSDEDVT